MDALALIVKLANLAQPNINIDSLLEGQSEQTKRAFLMKDSELIKKIFSNDVNYAHESHVILKDQVI